MKGAEIKSRIRGVSDTVKITKAMYTISAAKMTKVASATKSAREFLALAQRSVDHVYHQKTAIPYTRQNPKGKRCWLVIAADKGLCGDYNSRIFAAFEQYRAQGEIQKQDAVYSVGYAARQYLAAKGIKSKSDFVHMMQNPLPKDAERIADFVMREIEEGHTSKVQVLYTQANKLYDQEVVCETLLPLSCPKEEEEWAMMHVEDVPHLVRLFVQAKLYAVLCDASCSLNYKRMTGMQQATKNGEEMLETLSAQYNHERQASITNELNDANGAKIAQEDCL